MNTIMRFSTINIQEKYENRFRRETGGSCLARNSQAQCHNLPPNLSLSRYETSSDSIQRKSKLQILPHSLLHFALRSNSVPIGHWDEIQKMTQCILVSNWCPSRVSDEA
mmetsp:Transcript_2974/g.11384  ORF Transcript_2974/g.11384 Transcript_2974/m.11384 type:complete len:109 (+) Transcript_2974:4621-4947(+)